jgi:hypothetical protein
MNARESELLQLMQALDERHPDAVLFSLPHLGEVNTIEIGFRGERGAVATALADLTACLEQRELLFEVCGGASDTQGITRPAV